MTEGNNYPNPLDNFVSYSYHYIMCVANTTEAFRKMINSDKPLWSRANSARLGDEIDLDGDKAWLVIDTRRFSQYSITGFETQHAYGTGDKSNPSVPLTDCSIKIIDTTGLTFFPFLVDLMQNKVKSTRAASFFLLNLIFVGHRDDGTSETVSTCYMPLLLGAMEFEFDEKGSVYKMAFFEILAGTSNRGGPVQELNDLGITQSITSKGKSNSLKAMIQALEDALNKRSLEFYQSYVNTTVGKNGVSHSDTGKLVQYMINIPSIAGTKEDWSNFQLTLSAKSKYAEQHFLATKAKKEEEAKKKQEEVKAKDANQPKQMTPEEKKKAEQEKLEQEEAAAARASMGKIAFGRGARAKDAREKKEIPESPVSSKDGDGQITFAPNMKVTDAITQILMSCEEILDMGSKEKREAGEAVLFKILTTVTSDQTSYIIHYDIFPYYAPKVYKSDGNTTTTSRVKDRTNIITGKDMVKNLIHYDYIFTGLNSHIEKLKIEYSPVSAIALDMNLQLGSSRFAKNATAGGSTSETEKASKPTVQAIDNNPLIRPGEPIFPTIKTKINSKNASGHSTEDKPYEKSMDLIKKEQEYNITMAKMHFLGSIELNMTIRGNPNLLRKYSDVQERGSIPRHSAGMIISSDQIKTISRVDSETTKSNINNSVTMSLDSARTQYVKDYYNPKLLAVKKPSDDPILNKIDPVSLPVFVEIKIKSPNVDWTGQTRLNAQGQEEVLYANYDAFYDGVYQILSITHRLNEGKFEQEMILIPYEIDSASVIGNKHDADKSEGKKQVTKPTNSTPVPPI